MVQRITIADTNQRDAEGATMGKVRRPEVLSPPTSGKSCAENVVNTKRAQQAKERNSSNSTRSTRVGSAKRGHFENLSPKLQDGRQLTHDKKCANFKGQISSRNA
jgi:hypothetical protein